MSETSTYRVVRDEIAEGSMGIGEVRLSVSAPDITAVELADLIAKDGLDRDRFSEPAPRAPLASIVETDFDIIL